MKATKTVSGKWTCLGYFKDSAGIVHRKRFTCDLKRDAILGADTWMVKQKEADEISKKKDGKKENPPLTFSEAGKRYIKSREGICSPSTITGYYKILKNSYNAIAGQNIYDITQEDIQFLANSWALELTPKTVRNLHGFLSSVLKAYRPGFLINTQLPKPIKPDLYTPTDAEIQRLITAVRDTAMEIPVLLAATGSLRRSEICALQAEDVGDGWIRINKALVQDKDKNWVVKTTKTAAGTRITYVPRQITDRIRQLVPSGRVVKMSPPMISTYFPRVLQTLGLPRFRFHALRSYYASILHALGVPDKYIMQWGGWHDERTLQEHYQKAMPDKVPDMAQIGINHFQGML